MSARCVLCVCRSSESHQPISIIQLYHHLDINTLSAPASAPPANTLVLGLIKRAHIRNAVLDPNAADGATLVDPAKLRAISRLGGVTFARVGEGFDIPRPSWRAVGGEVIDLIEKEKTSRL